MKKDTPFYRLEEVCAVDYGTRVVRKRDGGSIYPVYGGGGDTFKMDTFNRESQVVVSRFGVSPTCVRCVQGRFFLNDSGLTITSRNPSRLLQSYLDHQLFALNDVIYGLCRGTAQKNLDVEALRDLAIAVPVSVSEQRRIVAILNKAFEAIATATANAEKNLSNAREIFASQLSKAFEGNDGSWRDLSLEDVAQEFGRGKSKHRPRDDPKLYGGKYPFIQTGDIRAADRLISDFSQTYSEAGLAQSKLWPKGTICITIAANIAETGILGFEACFPDSVVGLVVDESKAIGPYVEYALQYFKAALQAEGQGSAQANINLATFERRTFPFPDIEKQREIVSSLNDLAEAVASLEEVLAAKLKALAELKGAILARGFANKLAAEPAQNVVLFPKAIPNITATDLHAGVLAIAYQKHVDRNKQSTFQHVKSEKIAHMVEAFAGIELGRKPVKDAAGPNDFRHLQQVQHRAERANFFSFRPSGNGYQFEKKNGFNRLIEKTRAALGDDLEMVEKIIDVMVPMDFRQAEIFATVYAAWNNLLLGGGDTSDEAIVRAARDDWHPEKLKIPADRFFEALKWMRTNGFVPKGIGKKVLERTAA